MHHVLDVFAAMLLAIAVLLALAVTWVVAVRRDHLPAHTGVSTSAAILGVAFVAVAAAAGAFAVSLGLRLGTVGSAIAGVAVGVSILVWWPRGRRWTGRGVAAWALVVDASVVGLACAVGWLLTGDLPVLWVVAGFALCLVEAVVLAFGLRHVQVFLDDHARRVRPEPNASMRPRLGVPLLAVSATATALALFGLPVVAPADSGPAANTAEARVPKAAGTIAPRTTSPSESAKPDSTGPSDSVSPSRPSRTSQPRETEASQEPSTEPTTDPTTEPTEVPTTEPTQEPKPHPTGPPDDHPTHPPQGGGHG
jgi:hypothetical protein